MATAVATSSTATVTLGEAPGTEGQTRLAQAFVLRPNDRFLTFTVSHLDLQNNSSADESAPQDAFEVALLNATTGTGLWANGEGATLWTNSQGASRSDALLNLQLNLQLGSSAFSASLQERKASVVNAKLATDAAGVQTRTYTVDLRQIAAGTPLNLSFDLIGFGSRRVGAAGAFGAAGSAAHTTSTVSLRDVRMISTPQVANDAASLTEDSSAQVIHVKANDTDADAPGFALELVANAQHGSVQLLADGSFSYTPQANYFGADSFTYRYTDGTGSEIGSGAGLSEVATVNLTVTAVNDAPVAADVSATTAEDNTGTINLIAADVDNTATEVQFVIQTAPQSGSLTKLADGSYSYTPAAHFNGSDSFTYTVTDGNLVSNVATARITVSAVNDAPVAADEIATTAVNNAATASSSATDCWHLVKCRRRALLGQFCVTLNLVY